jgi:hypothetical protein
MFKRWLGKKKMTTNNAATSTVTVPAGTTVTATTTVAGANVASTGWTTYNMNTTAAAPVYTNITSAIGGGGAGNITINPISSVFSIGASYAPTSSIITLSSSGKEIVRLNQDGTVTWANGIQVDEAAEAFGRSLTYSAELKAGITKRVKLEMRDSVFEDLIGIAKEKGSLTVDDLTYLLAASKIVEKLKGGNE